MTKLARTLPFIGNKDDATTKMMHLVINRCADCEGKPAQTVFAYIGIAVVYALLAIACAIRDKK